MTTSAPLLKRVRPGRTHPGMTLAARVVPAVLLAGALTLLGIALYLKPSAEGVGTHQGLGLPACGFVTRFNMPCMTCGMTTSFSLAVRGRLWDSFTNQPMGAFLAVMTAVTVLVCGYSLFAGLDLSPLASSIWTPRNMIILGVLFVLAWIYKILLFHGMLG